MATVSALLPSQQKAELDLASRLDALTRPKGVQKPVLTYGSDHSGDDAVWVVFPVTTDIKLTKSRVKALFAFAEEVRALLRDLQLKEITYVRFREMDQDAAGE